MLFVVVKCNDLHTELPYVYLSGIILIVTAFWCNKLDVDKKGSVYSFLHPVTFFLSSAMVSFSTINNLIIFFLSILLYQQFCIIPNVSIFLRLREYDIIVLFHSCNSRPTLFFVYQFYFVFLIFTFVCCRRATWHSSLSISFPFY